jgi:hypothetical protein
MANDLAFYLREGAHKLRRAEFGFATVPQGNTQWTKYGVSDQGADILVPVDSSDPAAALAGIFHDLAYTPASAPDEQKWHFDCSEFVQVVNMYAWLKVLKNQTFNDRVIKSGGIKIKPFIASTFTARHHYYRREARGQLMKYRPNGDKAKEQLTCMKAWEVFGAAPIGSRVNFTNDRWHYAAYQYENTVKYSRNEVLAFPLSSTPMRINDFIVEYFEESAGTSATLEEASKYVWVKEVEFFQDVTLPEWCK